jgi:gliding motility-associated-like protein
VAFQENFNSGSPVGWQFTQNVTIANNTCGRPSPDGSNFMWMGDASVNPRDMTTVAFDLTLGGTICFDMRYSIQGDPSPCEGPDEPTEGVYLQYSINGGANWTNIQYWNPNGGNDPQLVNWNQYCIIIPPAARTTNTMIRWHQDAVSGAEYDHWGIDNVIITLNDPNYIISWGHDGYSYGYGSSGGTNPTLVTPLTTTTYQVQITDGNNTCTDNIQVVVNDPVIIVSAGNDTTICPGECVNIDATAYWEIEPPSSKTFVNDISQTISAGLGGGPIEIPISVGGVNLSSIQPGSIMEVCITGMSYFGQNFFPPSSLTVGSFSINLSCPSGASIQLIPSGVTTSTFILPGYVQTCFNMTTSNNIAASAPPYTNTFSPSQPFDNLVGCPANGQWEMSLVSAGGLGFGTGNFSGWSITIDDPGLTAPVNLSWSPTVNMTNGNTLTPTVCPSFTTTYTLTATNHPGCLPQSDDITITVPSTCCQLQLDNLVVVQPTCAGADGSIQIQVSGEIAGLRFSIDNGATYQVSPIFSGLSVGTYYVLINDDNNCPVGSIVTLSNANAPVMDDIQISQPSCAGNDGSITIQASGGGGGYQYSIDGGITFQATASFQNLGAGNYNIIVSDGDGCHVAGTATLAASGNLVITNVQTVNPSCGASDGSIQVTASGSGVQYSIDNGVTFQSASLFNNIPAGNYSVLVRDNAGCTASQATALNDNGAPQIIDVAVQNISCTMSVGSIHITATPGTNQQYSIDNGTTFQSSPVFNSLSAGTYTVVVTENGCSSNAVAVITGQAGIHLTAQVTDDGCGSTCVGVIQLSVVGGAAPYNYQWSGAISSTSSLASNVCRGEYQVSVTDANGCSGNLTVRVQGGGDVTSDFSLSPSEIILPDGMVHFTNLSQGANDFMWSFDNFGTSGEVSPDFNFSSLPPGVYSICLEATSTMGCRDFHCQYLTVKEGLNVFVPNSFTPNKDGLNDVFLPITSLIMEGEAYEFSVFSRWGELLFNSGESNAGWDGKRNGKDVPPGMYVWKLKVAHEVYGDEVMLGHVVLVR